MSANHSQAERVEDGAFAGPGKATVDLKTPHEPQSLMANGMTIIDGTGTYFSDDTSKTSFNGWMSEADSIKEEEIVDFVRYGNRDLYGRLGRMPLRSSHLLHYDDDEAKKMGDETRENGQLVSRGKVPVVKAETQASLDDGDEDPREDVDCPSEMDNDLVLLSSTAITAYRHCQPGMVIRCESPSCGLPKHEIAEGSLFAIKNGVRLCLECVREM